MASTKKIDPRLRAYGNADAPGGMFKLFGGMGGPGGGGKGGPPAGGDKGKGGPPAGGGKGGDKGGPPMMMGGAPADVKPGKAEGRVWGYSGPGDWLGEAPVITEIDHEVDVDVVVVGSGHSGVQAALAAAEKGARVAVLEKQAEDSFTWYGEDFASYNSQLAIKAGFGPYNLGEIVDEYITRGGGRGNPDIVRLYVQNSGPTMDHMLAVAEEMGVDPRAYTYDNTPDGWLIIQCNLDYDKYMETGDAYKSIRYDYPQKPGTKTWAASHQFMGVYNAEPIQGVAANSVLPLINQAMIDKAEQLGAEWFWGTPAVVLVQNDNGDVIGVIGKDEATGKYIKYNTTKGVVMAGGDYAANKEMCWALLNEYMERKERCGGTQGSFYSFMGGRTGDSVKMMCWAGGYVEPAPRGTMILGGGPGGPWGSNAMLWLNKDGKRFCNEGNVTGAQTATSRQPTGLGCLVTDKKWLKSVCASGLEHGGPNAGRPQYYQDMVDGMSAIQPGSDGLVENCTIAERGYSRVKCANTLEELAAMLGYPEEVIPQFIESIKHYNEMCYAGADNDFGKDPSAMIPVDEAPFYGCAGSFGSDAQCGPSMVTMSGVMTDTRLNVIDINKRPIKGLYACGNSLGGRYGTGYSTPSAGNSIGFAGTHGRLAGQFVCEE